MVKLAKRKIRDADIPFRIPEQAELAQRMDLCDEAIHLGRVLCALTRDEVETKGLLALMLFTHARRHARVDA